MTDGDANLWDRLRVDFDTMENPPVSQTPSELIAHGQKGALSSGERTRFTTLLRARHPVIGITTVEEDFALGVVVGAAIEVGKPVLSWSVVKGITEGLFAEETRIKRNTEHPAGALRNFVLEFTPRVFVLLDVARHLDDPVTLRCLREAIDHARRTRSHLVFIDHQDDLPSVIGATLVRFEIMLPTIEELESIVKDTLRHLRDEDHVSIDINRAGFGAIVNNLAGLTRQQARQLILEVGLGDKHIDANDLQAIVDRKRQLIRSEGLLQHVDQHVSIDDVAGMTELKRWLDLRKQAQSTAGRDFGLETPRGILLLGVPGAGKSLCAKAVAAAWDRPLLRLDAGVLFDRYIGESERRLRTALKQAEAMAPVILWVDEIEKAFASAASRSTDGGLSQRMFGSLLTWMQEHDRPVFIVATANDIEALPPELLRKGRFDEIFFVDLPNAEVRREILRLHLLKRKQDPQKFDLKFLAQVADGCSGAEIEDCIRSAIYTAFGEQVPVTTAVIEEAIRLTRPLSVTMAEKVAGLRQWAEGRCRLA